MTNDEIQMTKSQWPMKTMSNPPRRKGAGAQEKTSRNLQWVEEVEAGSATVRQIADREFITPGAVRKALKAARQAKGYGMHRRAIHGPFFSVGPPFTAGSKVVLVVFGSLVYEASPQGFSPGPWLKPGPVSLVNEATEFELNLPLTRRKRRAFRETKPRLRTLRCATSSWRDFSSDPRGDQC
jgi:hypothetical protein